MCVGLLRYFHCWCHSFLLHVGGVLSLLPLEVMSSLNTYPFDLCLVCIGICLLLWFASCAFSSDVLLRIITLRFAHLVAREA